MPEGLAEGVPVLAVAVLAILCLTGAWLDVRYRRLPNWLCGVTALAGLAQAALVHQAHPAPFWSFALHGAVALVVGIGLFALRWIGGGDAKFYAGLACWIPFERGAVMLVSVCLAGLVVLLGWFTLRRLQGKKIMGGKNDEAAKLPFGIAIALGAFLAFTA